MYDVFISYSREDFSIAQYIYDELYNKGVKVFFDKISIISEPFPKKIAKGIKESKVILFIASHNSVNSNYAPDELVFAKNNKPRNSIVVYRIDSSKFPDDIELLFASLNQRSIESDPVEVLLDDILYLLTQGEISRTPRVSKDINEDEYFEKLFYEYCNQNYYLVIQQEIKAGLWKRNWNHHLLLMLTYSKVGDRGNYGCLLNLYMTSGIVFFPHFYGYISQLWDMIKFGFIQEAKMYLQAISLRNLSQNDRICFEVNSTHIVLLTGHPQEALNQYQEILRHLSFQDRFVYLLKDFDTLNWMGYNQLYKNTMQAICPYLGYRPMEIFTTLTGHLTCSGYENMLLAHRWHWREGRIHIVLSFKKFNDCGNAIYYFVEHEKSILGRIINVLPFGLDESDKIEKTGRAFCQYRLNRIKQGLMIEEFNPITEEISCGEIILLNNKELHIKIIRNGNNQTIGNIRKFKAIGN